jgi:hypothetical protein
MAQSGRRLTARPVESEQPGAEINYIQEQQCMRKKPFASFISCLEQLHEYSSRKACDEEARLGRIFIRRRKQKSTMSNTRRKQIKNSGFNRCFSYLFFN